jgi:hypothetical protein
MKQIESQRRDGIVASNPSRHGGERLWGERFQLGRDARHWQRASHPPNKCKDGKHLEYPRGEIVFERVME